MGVFVLVCVCVSVRESQKKSVCASLRDVIEGGSYNIHQQEVCVYMCVRVRVCTSKCVCVCVFGEIGRASCRERV